MRIIRVVVAVAAAFLLAPGFGGLRAQQPLTLTVQMDKPGPTLDPIFYGLMTEEINFAYDGGLYAELIRNRTFKDDPQKPAHCRWSITAAPTVRSRSTTCLFRIQH